MYVSIKTLPWPVFYCEVLVPHFNDVEFPAPGTTPGHDGKQKEAPSGARVWNALRNRFKNLRPLKTHRSSEEMIAGIEEMVPDGGCLRRTHVYTTPNDTTKGRKSSDRAYIEFAFIYSTGSDWVDLPDDVVGRMNL